MSSNPKFIPMTDTLARAAATDAGNRRMREEGRTAWNLGDFRVACAEYSRLMPKNSAAVALGSLTSPQKAASARVNGRKGGRPKRAPA